MTFAEMDLKMQDKLRAYAEKRDRLKAIYDRWELVTTFMDSLENEESNKWSVDLHGLLADYAAELQVRFAHIDKE